MSQDTSAMEVGDVAAGASTDPDYITYLLDPEQEYNCYFVVGNTTVQIIERIGVVKKMLLAHSVVLRAELQDSKIAEKNDVHVTDLFPDTFKNLLRYVYGHDNTASLSFNEADNLLYAAEKYMMSKLKNKLATCLMKMLDYNNICSLMNNPACYTVLELNSAITEILQLETDKVLASPYFLDLCPDGFLKILEQGISTVEEIELWRAALKWAKNRTNSKDGQTLRNELSSHLLHIRVCTLTEEDLFMEVLPTKILTYDELILVGKSRRSGVIQPNLNTICSTIEKRSPPCVRSDLLELSLPKGGKRCIRRMQSKFSLITSKSEIELCSIQLYADCVSPHQCSCTISIANLSAEAPTVVSFNGQISSTTNWAIPIVTNEENVCLLPNSTYLFTLTFSCHSHHYGYQRSYNPVAKCLDFNVEFDSNVVEKILYKRISWEYSRDEDWEDYAY